MTAVATEHPERALMRDVVARGRKEVAVTTNPLAVAMGMTIVEASEGRVRARFSVRETFNQGNGVLQGGIVSALLDFGMAFAAFSVIPPGATIATVAQTTNFFRAARAGTLFVEASLEKAGRNMINARATLFDPDGKPLASATAPIAVLAHQPEATA